MTDGYNGATPTPAEERITTELEGETVIQARAVIGYLHTGIEKNSEYRTWTQGVTFVTRADYWRRCSTRPATAWGWRSCSASRCRAVRRSPGCC
jgi:NADH:ubiquinone oxidoreductase subunit D